MSTRTHDPRTEYHKRLALQNARVAAARRRDRQLGAGRLMALGVAVVLGGALVFGAPLPPASLVLPILAFLVMALWHESVARQRRRAERVARFLGGRIARLEGRWTPEGADGAAYLPGDHPYGADLDIVGEGSLFQHICLARTGAGEETLARWLLEAASPVEIRRRQEAVGELSESLALREDLVVAGDTLRAELHVAALEDWAGAPAAQLSGWLGPVLFGFHIALLAAVGFAISGQSWLWPIGVALVQALVVRAGSREEAELVARCEARARDLALLAELLERLERESFRAPLLREALASDASKRPSVAIRKLARLIGLLEWRRNQLFAPIAITLAWTTHGARRIERWRRQHGAELARWLEGAGTFEALSSLACRAWEHPDEIFPAVEEGDTPRFEGKGLGHPLLAEEQVVVNDIALGGDRRLLVVSGSNMSGKSTFLRTIGTLAVLAQAGATVRAEALRLSPLAIGASIRVQDSLRDGHSRFYSEIRRLRQLFELASGERALLFLLDELLQGTNSHDRKLGAEALARGLLETGALGLLTTHDLALSEMSARLPATENVHFEDRLEDGEILFDYRLRPGVVERSNAIELMRSVGLRV